MSPEQERYLEMLYFNPEHPASYSGINKLHRFVTKDGKHDIPKRQLEQWLRKQDAYSLHRQSRRRMRRLKVVAPRIDYQWESDLAVMSTLSKYNGGVNYFLLAIDVFSRFAWTRPLKTKRGEDMVEAFGSIFATGRRPSRLRSDKGTEYRNAKMQEFLRENGVESFVTQGDTKASIAERCIKTLKSKLARLMTHQNTFQWVSALDDVTKSYNSSIHRSLGMAPKDVTKEDNRDLWQRQYMTGPNTPTNYAFEVGDAVRLSHVRWVFKREYDEHWTREIFFITERIMKQNIPCYKVKDVQNEPVSGIFYEQELQKTEYQEDAVYKIENIVRRRTRRGRREVLVKWLGWDKKHNTWIPETEVQNIANT